MPTLSSNSIASASTVIKNMLRARLGRQWHAGDRLPPVKELARQLGTGQGNTHLAVRDLVAEGLLESRQRRGTYVIRTPMRSPGREAAVGSLADRSICLYHPLSPEDFVQRMIDAFTQTMVPTGVRIRTLCDPFQLRQSTLKSDPDDDAMVLFNPNSMFTVEARPDQLISVVTTAARIRLDPHHRYDMVGVDELNGGQLAGQMVRKIGCAKPGFVGRAIALTRYDATSVLRLCGFEEGWGGPLEPQHLITTIGYSPIAGGKAFRRYLQLDDKPDAIFCATDELAIGFAVAAVSHGLQPGKDFQLIGFDGQEQGQRLAGNALTTIKVPAAEMGRRAAQLLIERFADPDRPVHRLHLECELHRGSTTRM